jgi:hypothetical protein
MNRTPIDRTGPVGVVHLLVLLQGAVLVASTIEALVFLGFAGPGGTVVLVLTAASAVATLLAAAGLARGSWVARRLTLLAESYVLVVALLELALSLVLAGTVLVPVAAITRIAIPVAVIAILRRPEVRASFGATASSTA